MADSAMEVIEVEVAIDAPQTSAWELLADFGNPHRYVEGIPDAHLVSQEAQGVGAIRHCDLPRMMLMRQYIVEEITEWTEGRTFTYRITDTTAPITDSRVVWSAEGDETSSKILVRAEFRPKGLLGRMMRPVLLRQLTGQLRAGLEDMKRLLEKRAHLRAA